MLRIHFLIDDFGVACGRTAKLTTADIEGVTCDACINRLKPKNIYVSEGRESHSFFTKVVGVTHTNDDGSSRQGIIARCSTGEPLALIREPKNRFDSGAISVFRANGEQLGYVPSHVSRGGDSSGLADQMDGGREPQYRISRLTSGDDALGVNIEIRDGEFDSPVTVSTAYSERFKPVPAFWNTGSVMAVLAVVVIIVVVIVALR